MKSIQTNRGWWLITPESDEQAAELVEFLSRYKHGTRSGPTPSPEFSGESDKREPSAALSRPR
jgi:hypothetical protein